MTHGSPDLSPEATELIRQADTIEAGCSPSTKASIIEDAMATSWQTRLEAIEHLLSPGATGWPRLMLLAGLGYLTPNQMDLVFDMQSIPNRSRELLVEYLIDHPKAGNYFNSRLREALRYPGAHDELRRVACLAGLAAEHLPDNIPDPARRADLALRKLTAILARGQATFNPQYRTVLLERWASLVVPGYEATIEEIEDAMVVSLWARRVMRMAPDTPADHLILSEDTITLSQGVAGREFGIKYTVGQPMELTWASSTGKPDAELGIELLLAHPGRLSYGRQEDN